MARPQSRRPQPRGQQVAEPDVGPTGDALLVRGVTYKDVTAATGAAKTKEKRAIMAEEKNMNAENLENVEQLSEPELAEAAGGWGADNVTYISCNKNYCGYVQQDGTIRYTRCKKCNHAMHFETHSFLGGVIIGHTYCDKCDCWREGATMEVWHGTKEELIASANEAL